MVSKRKNKIWLLALGLIVILAVILIFFIDLNNEGNKPPAINQSQKNELRQIISSSLKVEGDNITHYQVDFSNKILKIGEKRDKIAFQVVLLNDSIIHVYLIDLTSKKILMHTKSEIFNWLLESCKNRSQTGVHHEEMYLMPERCLYE